jgi:hypothetical protein
MKTLVVVPIAAILLSLFSISAATSSENSAVRDLAAAKSLAFGGVGVAGLMSEGERNLRAVLEQPDASQQLQAGLAHATPAGKLYILVGLRRCDRTAYQKLFDSLGRPNDDVEVVRGCMISKESFRQVLSQVKDGRFDDYLSRRQGDYQNVAFVRRRGMKPLARVPDQSATFASYRCLV